MSSRDFIKKYFFKTPPTKHQPIFLTDPPAPVSDIYVLRTEQEEELYQALKQGGRHILLYGPGGSGKTHLARKLFYRLCEDYERLAWVEYGTDLRTALTAPPDENSEENRDVLFDRGIQALEEAPEKTILFIDDAKENAMDDDTLAQITGMGVTILLTSRCKKISPYETWEIAPITIADCVNLFYANYHFDSQRKHQKIVRKLVSQLECNVFAVLLLARVVGELDNLPRIVRHLQKGSLMDHIGQLIRLAELSPSELLVLQCLALMPSGETLSTVCDWFGFPEELADALCKKGWLDNATGVNSYILHDLLREYLIKAGLPEEVFSLFLIAFLKDDFFTASDTEEEIEYKLTAVQRALLYTRKNTTLYVFSLLRMSEFQRDRGQYRRALEYTINALHIANEIDDCSADLLHDIHWQLGMNYSECGMYSQALNYYHLCETHEIDSEQSNNRLVAMLWNNMGTCYGSMKNYNKALIYFQKAIVIQEQVPGIYHHETAGTYSNIGNSYSGLGNHQEALTYHKKALDIREKLADDELYTAGAHDNIGVTYRNLGYYQESLQHHTKAFETRKRILGCNHPDTAITCYNLSVVYDKLNELQKCLSFGFIAYEVFYKMLGSEHDHTQQAFDTLQELFVKYHPEENFNTWLSQKSASSFY